MRELHSINLAFNHKPFNANSEQHKKFLQSNYEKTHSLLHQHPYLDLKKELAYFKVSGF